MYVHVKFSVARNKARRLFAVALNGVVGQADLATIEPQFPIGSQQLRSNKEKQLFS